ncbi:FKBP-type peptidyl-prolyl cis-trans isomerase SlyD [Tepidimonas alkaliphilus]|uniref:Peptidyl-prolyl cis-trans isomerase n=1 Tax=Tepidimonas alkaliphilus TaxID=2588942 RepID=A0A554WD46_9BURK|nr:FKBP-type peptidyl-prolyl cis-trans isomerase [Tepidimonas alkaliphilus]TSE21499.1 FKBP-type peptidyl-prolyl cis-trans isomerase SlyD [Tepidimonas alkaliphilus]
MNVTPPCVVSLTWTLADTLGDVLDESDEPVEFLVGGRDLLASIERALQGREPGERLELHLEPQDAFGDFDDRLIFLEPRSAFPAELEVGMAFEGLPPGCSADAPRDRIYFVSEIYPDHVVLDGNHPLAGMALRVALQIHGVRPATPEELARGSVGGGLLSLPAAR